MLLHLQTIYMFNKHYCLMYFVLILDGRNKTLCETEHTLMVQGESKVDKELNKEEDYNHKPSLSTVILKWLSTIFLGILILGSVTISKISVISLSERMNDAKTSEKDVAKLFVMLQLIGIIPNLINLLRALLKVAFRSDIPSLTCGILVWVRCHFKFV